MLVSVDWLNDYVDLKKIATEEMSNRVTMAICEVEGFDVFGECLDLIKVAKIISIRPHPEADKLNLVTVDYAGDSHKEVVCGAPNVRVGLIIPYAPMGTKLPNGMVLEPKKIRGILSDGMLCSEVELGLGEAASGLMELAEDSKVGTGLLNHLGMSKDMILDIDNKSLTHRPDLWGHKGIARDVAAAFDLEFNDPFTSKAKSQVEKLIKDGSKAKAPVVLEKDGESALQAYYGITMEGVTISESPQWLKNRLTRVGLRPINNIVDISNYVMLELGHPLHIFDRHLIREDKIVVKRLGKEESLTTLDEEKRALIKTDTVVCDGQGPLVIAGIMGGLSSGVSEKTKDIFIEVANWIPHEVRRTSSRLGLRSDSSQRYEKSLDGLQCYETLLKTIQLVKQLCPEAKIVGAPQYIGDDLKKIPILKIETSVNNICRTLGKEVQKSEIERIFKALNFEIKEGDVGHYTITVPSNRATKDVEFEADLIEEIGRIIGYDNISPVGPEKTIKPLRFSPRKQMERRIEDFLSASRQAYEIYTYPMVGEKLLKKAMWTDYNDDLKLENALSNEQDRMRPSLLPSILQTIATNQKHHQSYKCFELGRVYKSFNEERLQVIYINYNKSNNCFSEVVNSAEQLLSYLKLPGDVISPNDRFKNPVVASDWRGIHPHQNLEMRIMGKLYGKVFTLHPYVLSQFKIKGNVSVFILDYTDFADREVKDKLKFKPLSQFPCSSFDCTVVAKETTEVGDILNILKKIRIKEILDIKIVDIFVPQDSMDNEKKKMVTLRSTLGSPDKTLSGDIIKSVEEKIVFTLGNGGFSLKA